ncbi:hypothetical protein EZJ43_07895 [Pedobacter changchengzhani]|uniref:Uncharacterized protein n=1 Tax=Pedobacter changchengzhani TaxID=2529274 RepID=A0A4R5MLE8_9SPHI|nr:hypothetical protein [Pedobacter changchengzhani]TDG36432.1 hypothetical protein EZJ43_07895 [Pedobacter changchengzhani]
MKNSIINIIILSLMAISCTSNKKADKKTDSITVDTAKVNEDNARATDVLLKPDTTKISRNDLPIYGELTKESLAKYYPNITDTIKRLFKLTAKKLDLNPGNGISAGMLYNSAVSAQMFLCTHDKKLNLIDKLYIGTATDFDVTSHTIAMKIINKTEITFDQVDWGYVENGEEDIDTIGHQKWDIHIDKNGFIKNKITVYKKLPSK